MRSLGLDPLSHAASVRSAAALAIAIAAAANIVAVDAGAAVVNASSTAKFAAIGLLVVVGFVLGGAHGGSLTHLTEVSGGSITASGLGLGLVSVLWAYDGFSDVCLVAGEVREPHRTLPKAIIVGTLAITVIYVLANATYLYVLPPGAIGSSPLVAADAMASVFGPTGATLVSALVAISTFGSLNGQMLASPRIFFTMAEDGLLPARLATVHGAFRTPYTAILLAAGLGILLVASQTFETLTNAFVLAIWPFYALSVGALYRLRRLHPDRPRPYLVAGYPVVPAVFILAVVWFVGNAFVREPLTTGVTFALVLAGLPVYELMIRSASATGNRRPSRSRR
jgi:amino acid transporter